MGLESSSTEAPPVQETSPLRRVLRLHFTQYKGLTASLPVTTEGLGEGEPEYPIYKDTASGAQV